MNLSPAWIPVLTKAGYKADHWQDLGTRDAADSTILDSVRAAAAVLLTHDLDFGTILAHTHANGPSVIQLREQNVDPTVVGDAVLAALESCSDSLSKGALVTVDLRRAKARILPIGRPIV